MKKVLLLAFCAAAMLTVQAQPTVTNSWTKSQTDILSVANVNNSNPVAVSHREICMQPVFLPRILLLAVKR